MNNTSFKDKSGHVFERNGFIFRRINICGKENYEHLMNSGLYDELVKKNLLISHKEYEPFDDLLSSNDSEFYKLIKPEQIKYITYPYEWCFSALKDAALLTLKIQKTALKYSMTLKDASAYNIQFLKGQPIFIDTLSFEMYKDDSPWNPYRQFCQQFLGPLALMSYTDIDLNKLLTIYIDGIPLKIQTKLLPLKTKLNPLLLSHIHLHSFIQKKYESDTLSAQLPRTIDQNSLIALIDSLEDAVKSLKFPNIKTQWGDYYKNTNYTERSFQEKQEIISKYIDILAPESLCDLGANRGDFTRIASEKNINSVAFDIDPAAVEDNYRKVKKEKNGHLLPLIQDLTNPSPSIGFANDERQSFTKRFKCDVIMALALIHHLAICDNLPFENIAQFFSSLAPNLIIEFVPKEDSKVQLLLSTRDDIFDKYDKENFETEFRKYYEIIEQQKLEGSERILYLMKRKQK